MTPIERVRGFYAAFRAGDIPSILAGLAEDVVWEYGHVASPIPWLNHRKGRADVVGFFNALKALDIIRFEPRALLADGNLVVALFELEFVVKATGKRVIETDEVHIWRFNQQGLVERFRHQVDSWAMNQALAA